MTAEPSRTDRIAGCLLGGAVGDALGAPIEFLRLSEIRDRFGPAGLTDYAPAYGRLGAITDDTQMTLFTAEGLLRAASCARRGTACDVPAIVHGSYLRWLRTQGYDGDFAEFRRATRDVPGGRGTVPNGWLGSVRALRARRAPGNTCLAALRSGRCGRVEGDPINGSKGCGGVVRAAPAAAVADSATEALGLGSRTAAVTHGHPTGWLAAGALAAIVYELFRGRTRAESVDVALRLLREEPGSGECVAALEAARALAIRGQPSAAKVTTLGQGWVAEEALAIGVYAALVAEEFRGGVLLAVNHDGDSDSTGSIAGNILGAASGRDAIPAAWLERLELRDVLEEVAADLATGYEDSAAWTRKYPGC